MSDKSSSLHQAFAQLYEERWQAKGGTLLAFADAAGLSRETIRGWLQKDRIELLENIEEALDALGAHIVIKKRRRSRLIPVDRRRTTIYP